MKARVKLAALILCAALLFAGCGKEEKSFVWYTADTIKTLDPQLAFSPAERSAVKHLFSGLYRMDAEGRPVPDMAAATHISPDGLVYTFELEDDGLFGDGKETEIPVTAQDYVFALRRVVDPSTNSPHAQTFAGIAGAKAVMETGADPAVLAVRAVDELTLEIRLAAPDSGFLEKLASCGAMPCQQAFFDSCAGSYGLTRDQILGNGPYRLTGWTAAAGLTLRLQEGQTGLADRIRLVPDDGEVPAAQLLAEEKQDLAPVTDPDMAATLTAQGLAGRDFETGTMALLFNCEKRGLAVGGVRQALACQAQVTAADWLAENAPAYLAPAEGLVPGGITLGGESYRAAGNACHSLSQQQRYAAYQLGLAEAGLEKLSGITVLIPQEASAAALYRAINQDWQRELGAFFSVEELPMEEILRRVERGDYHIALISRQAETNDPAALLELFAAGGVTGWQSETFDALLASGRAAADSAQKQKIYFEAEQLLLKEAPVVPLAGESRTFFVSADFEQLALDPFGPVFDLTQTAG